MIHDGYIRALHTSLPGRHTVDTTVRYGTSQEPYYKYIYHSPLESVKVVQRTCTVNLLESREMRCIKAINDSIVLPQAQQSPKIRQSIWVHGRYNSQLEYVTPICYDHIVRLQAQQSAAVGLCRRSPREHLV